MQLHSDTTLRAVVDASMQPWTASPQAGVERRLLHRDGGEDAQATTVVRYAAGAQFNRHMHPLGEEILVLSGDLHDETGQYEAGTYIKNPAGSSHAPGSRTGCTLFVKLRHLDLADQQRIVVSTRITPWFAGAVPGLTVMPLSTFDTQNTALVRWAPDTRFNRHRHFGGEEIYVINGVFEDEHGQYPSGTWLRSPHMSEHTPFSRTGCTILVKTGHLLQMPATSS